MFIAVSTRTMAGAARIAAERAAKAPKPVAIILPFKRHRRTYEPVNVPSAYEVARARHKAFLASLDINTQTPFITLIGRVAGWHGYTAEEMIKPCRKREMVAARADCIAAVKYAYPSLSLPRLGQIFGGRDHTTILHYLRKRAKA